MKKGKGEERKEEDAKRQKETENRTTATAS
jgi:hypothetical protein